LKSIQSLPLRDRWIIPVAAALGAVQPISTDLIAPSLPALAAESEGTLALQTPISAYLGGFALAHFAIGPLGDRFGRKPVALAGLALYAIMALAAAATDDLQSLAAYRFVQGLGGAAGPILSRAVIRDVKEPHEAANALALMGALVGVAPLFAPIVGGALTEFGGWRATFVGMAVYALFALGVIVAFLPETRPVPIGPARRVALDALRERAFWSGALSAGAAFTGLSVFIGVSGAIFQRDLGAAPTSFGFWFSGVVAGFILGSLAAARIVGHWSLRRRLVSGGLVMSAAALAMTALGAIWTHPVAIAAPMAVYALGWGLMQPAAQAAAIADFPDSAAQVSALYGFVQVATAAGLSYALAPFAARGALQLGAVLSVMAIAAAAIALAFPREGPAAQLIRP
jgi:DHA1 family bicyclomycin/chloramphenicol resistance-like MFS transporter